MGMFVFLKHGVSIILLFIGLKMIVGVWHPAEEWFKLHTFVSLFVIATALTVSIVLSVWHNKTRPPASDGKPIRPGGDHT
jgi:tellurite resistance protein TerC